MPNAQRDVAIQPGETAVTAALRQVVRLAGGVVTFTTNGTHSAGSFHYSGAAVDVALPSGPSWNSPALGAVAAELLRIVPLRFIREFIWAGPQPIYVKNGRHVAPYAVSQHRNHIHLAVTPAFTYTAPPAEREASVPDAMPDYEVVAPPVSISITPDGNGYIILCADGGVFCFGTARYLGRVHPKP